VTSKIINTGQISGIYDVLLSRLTEKYKIVLKGTGLSHSFGVIFREKAQKVEMNLDEGALRTRVTLFKAFAERRERNAVCHCT
jgi:hypothetical protein